MRNHTQLFDLQGTGGWTSNPNAARTNALTALSPQFSVHLLSVSLQLERVSATVHISRNPNITCPGVMPSLGDQQ